MLGRPRLDDYATLPARTRWVVAGLTTAASLLVMTWWAAPLAGAPRAGGPERPSACG